MIDYEKELNDEQCRVVLEKDGPLLVIAGAGSGKTRTLTYRVARLIESGNPPERILLATFTNKAARSMMSRVAALMEMDISRLWGGTFHHLGHRVLRAHAKRLGYENNFLIIDSDDAKQMMNRCIDETVKNDGPKFPRGDVLRGVISFSRNTDEALADVIEDRYPYLTPHLDAILAVAQLYGLEKKRLNVMDFDDLLINWRRLLVEHPDLQSSYAERFLHVLVDEYQDTNVLQSDITDLLASHHQNIMVVGDDAQSIYAFRGANYANIMDFPEKYKECKIYRLEVNYRSTPEILNMANLSILNNERQFKKSLRAIRPKGVLPALVPLRNVQMQANFVVQRIIELIREGYPIQEIAVLYRAHFHSMDLQMEMTRRGIPFTIRSGIRFFEQAHIKDVTAYMRITVNPRDEMAWKRVLCLQHRVGRQTADKLWQWLASQEEPLVAAVGDDFLRKAAQSARPGLAKLQELFKELVVLENRDIGMIIETILTKGYDNYLQATFTDATQRTDDLYQLAVFAAKFASLEDFLQEMVLLANIGEEGETDDKGGEGRVILSTIHQAKGLEWSVVFIPWCAEGMIPLGRALADPEGEEEERRLFYVAITRAKDQLYLCYPTVDYRRGVGYVPVKPSRFIRELTPALSHLRERPYEHWQIDEE